MSDEIKTATKITARMQSVECPYCEAEQDGGWISDPRGKRIQCDDCGKDYVVDLNAQVVIT